MRASNLTLSVQLKRPVLIEHEDLEEEESGMKMLLLPVKVLEFKNCVYVLSNTIWGSSRSMILQCLLKLHQINEFPLPY